MKYKKKLLDIFILYNILYFCKICIIATPKLYILSSIFIREVLRRLDLVKIYNFF